MCHDVQQLPEQVSSVPSDLIVVPGGARCNALEIDECEYRKSIHGHMQILLYLLQLTDGVAVIKHADHDGAVAAAVFGTGPRFHLGSNLPPHVEALSGSWRSK